jgi:hypothetical protein
MTGWRVYPAIWVAVALAGCSGVHEPTVAPPAEPRTLELGWVEPSPELGLTFRVDRLVVRRDGWELTAAVRNRGGFEYFIQRPHQPGGSMFGLVLLRSTRRDEVRELTADFRKAPPFLEAQRITPPLPRLLPARAHWRGTLTGSQTLRSGSVVRVLFGRFVQTRGDPRYLLWVTEHSVRL